MKNKESVYGVVIILEMAPVVVQLRINNIAYIIPTDGLRNYYNILLKTYELVIFSLISW